MTSTDLLERPEGGSINDIRFEGDKVVKSYSGTIDRGYQKLREEYYWLSNLPQRLTSSFTRPLYYMDAAEPRRVELHLARESKIAVAKGILKGQLSEKQTHEIVRRALSFLSKELYPVRTARADGRSVYERYHRSRVLTATEYLRKHPDFEEIVEARQISVNGQNCPSVSEFLAWIEEYAEQYFSPCRLVAVHGDAHLDNILTNLVWEHKPDLTFIDPRGDVTGPPHYDFAKLLKALEGYYDIIHYGLCSVGARQRGSGYEIFLDVDRSFDGHYASGLAAALDQIDSYADAESVTADEFVKAALVAECTHVLSFSFYHAYAPEPNPNRVRAYLAIFALMARRLMSTRPGWVPDIAGEPLLPH